MAGDAAAREGRDHLAAVRIVDLYERTAADFDRQRSRNLMERAWLERFAQQLPVGASILDLGCGMGEPMAAYLVDQGFAVAGVDAAPAMIDRCRERFPAHTWHCADMRTLNLGRRYTGILAWDSFFHLPPADQRAMFALFAAHAAPAAALMFTSGPAAGEAIGTWQGEPLYHASLSPDEYRSLLAASGFDVVAHIPDDPACGSHTVWLARSKC